MSGDLLAPAPAPKPEKRAITSADIRAALKERYGAPSHALVFEVAQGTGIHARRHLDAVAMDLWPSRGLTLHGIEIKISRGDYMREIKDPEKAEQIGRYCDLFSIAAPPGVVAAGTLPLAWGLLEYRGGKMVTAKEPLPTKAQAVDRHFLAAMLRAASRRDSDTVDALIQRRTAELEKDFQERVDRAAYNMTYRRDTAAKAWHALVEAIGEEAGKHWLDDTAVIRAVQAVLRVGATEIWSGLPGLEKTLGETHARVREALAGLGIELATPAEGSRKRGRR